jgi:hypothetical protein
LNKPKIIVEEVPKSWTQHSLPKLLTSQGNASKEENGAEALPLPGKSLGFSPGIEEKGGAGKTRDLNGAFMQGTARERRRRRG